MELLWVVSEVKAEKQNVFDKVRCEEGIAAIAKKEALLETGIAAIKNLGLYSIKSVKRPHYWLDPYEVKLYSKMIYLRKI